MQLCGGAAFEQCALKIRAEFLPCKYALCVILRSSEKKCLDEFWMRLCRSVSLKRKNLAKEVVSFNSVWIPGWRWSTKAVNYCDLHACPNLNWSPLLLEPHWAQRKQGLIREEDRKRQRVEGEERVGVGGQHGTAQIFSYHISFLWSLLLCIHS